MREPNKTGQLIDAGKSRRGWSFYSTFIQCKYKHRIMKSRDYTKGKRNTAKPLLIGTLGHTAQAHHHTIEAINKYGSVVVNGVVETDASKFLDPIAAIDEHCRLDQEMGPYRKLVQSAYLNYSLNPPPVDPQYLVETEAVGVIGKKDGEWGYWLIREDSYDLLNEKVKTMPSADGKTIRLTPLGVPDHEFDGLPVYLSRRWDLVTKSKAGWVKVIDHKHQQNIFSKADKYNADMGFAAIWSLAMQKWPSTLDSVDIHSISVNEKTPGKTICRSLRYNHLKSQNLPHLILRTAREMATLDMDERRGYIDRTGWPQNGAIEQGGACISMYKNEKGWSCPLFEHCHHGKDLY